MYLVLTALLALNVSNEILNAFKTLSTSISKSNQSIDTKTKEIYTQIIASEKEPGQAEKVRPYREQADQVVKESDLMWHYLEDWKKKIILEAGGYSKEPGAENLPDKMDNIDATTTLLVEKGGGTELSKKISTLRHFLLSMVPNDSASMSPSMPLVVDPVKPNDHNPKGDWNIGNFEHMPAIASLALFSKFQNDVRSSEAMVIKRLAELSHAKDLKYDTTAAVAMPQTTYALQGETIKATILMAAFNKSNQPTVNIQQGGGEKKPAKNGVIEWETKATGTGLQTVKGTITITPPGLEPVTKPWTFDYMVGTSGASLQLDKMNVFYIGVENPVSVSAAGYSIEDVYLDLPPGGTATGGNGHYSIVCTQPNPNFIVNIMAKSKAKDGTPSKVSSIPIRVKYIPDPVAYLLGKKEGVMSAALFRNAIAPNAVLEKFEFEAKFVITEFSVSMLPRGQDYVPGMLCKKDGGARFSDNADMLRYQAKCKPGDRIYIEGIKGVGPDKKVRALNPILLTLN